MFRKMCAAVAAVALSASVCSASFIVTPTVVLYEGDTLGGNFRYYAMLGGFDAQPTLVNGVPTGGDQTLNAAGWQSGGIIYLDFGPDWEGLQIESTWTKYMQWSTPGTNPFARVEWDTDRDKDNGTAGAAGFNFNSRMPQEWTWLCDTDLSANPSVAKGRYLLMEFGPNGIKGANEYAFVAVPEPASLTLLGAGAAALLIRKRIA